MSDNPLRIGPVRADQKINPQDPDEIATITGNQGVKYDALRLIQANAGVYEKLGPVLALPRDPARTKALDEDEVADEAGSKIVQGSASVRGSGDGPRVVVYLTESETGRTAKGMVPYSGLKASQRAFEEQERLRVDSAKAARVAGADQDEIGEDPRVSVLTDELERLRSELKAAQAEPEEASAPEPYEGFNDANVGEVQDHIAGIDDPLEREILKRKVREAEEASDAPREGVMKATEPVALVPAAEASEGADADSE